jgi:outer membrane immunogenic protein
MKKFLLGSVGLAVLIAGPAMAADMPVAPPPPPVVYYDWTGAYIGFNAGSVWSDIDRTYRLGAAGRDTTIGGSDGIFGFHAGAQWQWGAWVLGVEAALSGCFNECRRESGENPVPPFGVEDRFQQNKMTNLFTVGPRLGYAWDRFMIFASGGYASADLKSQNCIFSTGLCPPVGNTPPFLQVTSSRNQGWYAGGGFDYMVHKGPLVDVLLGVEYQHFDVGHNENAFCLNPGCSPASINDYDLGSKGDIVRARLTIKTSGYSFLYR